MWAFTKQVFKPQEKGNTNKILSILNTIHAVAVPLRIFTTAKETSMFTLKKRKIK
jgi:hypothetical protein